jgi:hypothetical protein
LGDALPLPAWAEQGTDPKRLRSLARAASRLVKLGDMGTAMKSPYTMLGLNLAISALVMYLVMFAMIDGFGDFYNNLNTFYMALTMVAPMAMLMLLTMGPMYRNRKLNLALHAVFVALFILALAGTRTQATIGDEQFLRSMIPHHSGAILMCREASITDPEIVALCAQIQRSQRDEIDQMKRILARY